MNPNILRTEVQDFIKSNLNTEISAMIFKGSPFPEITVQELANQIIAKGKSVKKLPTWFHQNNIYFPQKISIEQTSSEITALYKSELVEGNSLIDLSGGFGVDTYYFSKKIKKVTHCEINKDLSKIVGHNFKQLETNNVTLINEDGIQYLKDNDVTYDYIYIDPSRRDATKNKVFLLKDCTPNVPETLDILFSKSENIIIKTSPILDITSTINELSCTKEIHIVAVNNEVKELLFVLKKGFTDNIRIKTINILKDKKQEFQFEISNEQSLHKEYAFPKKYLYEPNAAILKSGGFHEIPQIFELQKLHEHTHLYTSDNLIDDFPGRKFQIEKIMPYNKKQLLKYLPEKKANITVRNFPKTVAQIRKETKIKDGGEIYIFFTKLQDNSKVLIINNKIN
ncbi:THUMP-like domain-containing protein [Tenacibaculum amylolyticum]|uniref:THUMP-like domain-containing protein n=1 Tax=Tenacibaculum amylolyticum TaxID=104269 RepID=UPI0038942E5B